MSQRPRWSLAAFALLCAVLGCGEGPKAEFGWRHSTKDLIPAANQAVKQAMLDNFGTPHDLVAWERMPVDYDAVVKELASSEGGEEAAVETPSKRLGDQMKLGRVVYMKNCMHCHGVAGDGNGPTAKYLNPKPRDFRLGIVKFTSTLQKDRATRNDLHRTITNGIPGTYMPSFLLMKDGEKTAVVEYLRWLAMRGEMEKRMGDDLADYSRPAIESAARKAKADFEAAKAGEKPASEGQMLMEAKASFDAYSQEEFPAAVDESGNFVAEVWTQAEEESSLIVPKSPRVADTAESRLRGRLLFMSNRAKCYTCHGPLGRGDGSSKDDFWPKEGSKEKYTERGLHDLWGNLQQPRDLTKGQYRGGRRPLDIYRRLFAGIKGTQMPPFGTVLKDEEIWDLVNYVMSIPFESQTPSSPKPAAMASMPHPPEQDR